MLNSQIKSQNHRIRSNTTEITKKTGSQEGKTGQGKPGEATTPGERTARYHSAAVVPDIGPNFSSLVRRNSYIILPSLLRTRHVLFDPCSSTIARFLTTVLLLLLLDVFPVAAGIAERVGGAAALFKVIVSSFLDFCLILHIHCVFSFKSSPFSPIFGYVDQLLLF